MLNKKQVKNLQGSEFIVSGETFGHISYNFDENFEIIKNAKTFEELVNLLKIETIDSKLSISFLDIENKFEFSKIELPKFVKDFKDLLDKSKATGLLKFELFCHTFNQFFIYYKIDTKIEEIIKSEKIDFETVGVLPKQLQTLFSVEMNAKLFFYLYNKIMKNGQ